LNIDSTPLLIVSQMVADAKKEQELAERKSEQLRIQLKDNETLMTSQQEQLTELKLVMQQMGADREEIETHTNGSATPSSPNAQINDNMSKLFEALNLTPNTPGVGDITPAPATSFTHLMKPVCRTDLAAYDDFKLLLQSVQKSQPPSRVTSGSYGGLNVMGLGKLGDHSPFSHSTANGSNSSLSTTQSASPATPQAPSTNGTPPPRDPHVPLKETRFYKRVVSEDVEPTLRLDLAPGVSWLTRRTVLTAICEGGLIVEPMPASTRIYVFSCAMCGEHRKGEEYLRTHRFRTSDNEAAQRYPLCISCLDKVRACCDFVGYLRMIKDGHMRIHDADEEKDAWEECVKFRERLFWCRIGGGVVPAFVPLLDSPKPEEVKESLDSSRPNEESAQNGAGKAENSEAKAKGVRRFSTKGKRASIGTRAVSRGQEGPAPSTNEDTETVSDEVDKQLHNSLRDSVNSKRSSQGSRPQTPSRKSEKLAISIPGAFK
jgi:Rab guanine nucleotide exchange factor SEC2